MRGMSYRLAPEHKWPAQPRDVAAAFTGLVRELPDRGGDASRIFLFGHSSGCTLVAIVATDARYLRGVGLAPADIAGVIPMGCRLNDYVAVTDTPPSRHEASSVPPNRVDQWIASDGRFTSLEQRNGAVPALHVSAQLPPTLVLIAEEERFFPPILADVAEFVGRALVAGAEADIVILDDRRHMSAIRMMVTPDDTAVATVAAFVRNH